MARIRSMKPEFWSDRKLARLSRDARLLYVAMWNFADEHGRLHGDSRYIKGHCLPYEDDLNLVAIDHLLDDLAAHGRVVRYEHDGDPYLHLPKLSKHQRLEAAKVPSRLPAPPVGEPSSAPPTGPGEDLSESRADESAPRADLSAPIVAQQVAGSRLQVAGGRGQGPGSASGEDAAAPPRLAAVGDSDVQSTAPVVAAYVEGATSAGKPRPSAKLVGKVGRDGKRLLSEGVPLDEVIAAARSCGARGWDDLDRERQQPQRGRPVGDGRVNSTEQHDDVPEAWKRASSPRSAS